MLPNRAKHHKLTSRLQTLILKASLRYCFAFVIFISNFEHIQHVNPMFLFVTLNLHCLLALLVKVVVYNQKNHNEKP